MRQDAIEDRARLKVRCTCRKCRNNTSFWDANLALTIRAMVGSRWAEDNPLEAAASRGEVEYDG